MSKKAQSKTQYRCIAKFRYPINGVTQWVQLDQVIELPAHAAEALMRQRKVEII